VALADGSGPAFGKSYTLTANASLSDASKFALAEGVYGSLSAAGGQLVTLVDLQRPVGAALRQRNDIALLNRGIRRDLAKEHGERAQLQYQQQHESDHQPGAETVGLAQGSIFVHGRDPPFK
jgi:hypothetical protein